MVISTAVKADRVEYASRSATIRAYLGRPDAGPWPEGRTVADDQEAERRQGDRAADGRDGVGQPLGRRQGGPKGATGRTREQVDRASRWLHRRQCGAFLRANQQIVDR